jgi:hypothetical protein
MVLMRAAIVENCPSGGWRLRLVSEIVELLK